MRFMMDHYRTTVVVIVAMTAITQAGLADKLKRPPTQYEFGQEEVLWFDCLSDRLVVCFGDATVASWNLTTGRLEAGFRLPAFVYGRTQLLIGGEAADRLVVIDDDGPSATIRCFHLPDGVRGSDVTIKFSQLRNAVLDRAAGQLFFTLLGESFLRMKLESGQIEWRRENNEDHLVGGRILADGTPLYALFADGRVSGLSENGVRWQTPQRKASQALLPTVAQPSSGVVCSFDPLTNQVLGLRAGEGTVLWSKHVEQNADFCAISRDGTRQAFFMSGTLEITEYPAREAPIARLKLDRPDVVFVNGTEVLYIPRLQERLDPARPGVAQLSRASRTAVLYDFTQSKTVLELNLSLVSRP